MLEGIRKWFDRKTKEEIKKQIKLFDGDVHIHFHIYIGGKKENV